MTTRGDSAPVWAAFGTQGGSEGSRQSSDEFPPRVAVRSDKLSIWPLDSGQYGLDAGFQGRSGFERMERHEAALKASGVEFSLVDVATACTPRTQTQRTIILVM
jgi:hypothetical protein